MSITSEVSGHPIPLEPPTLPRRRSHEESPALLQPTPTVLEENQRLSRSLLFRLQRRFFEEQGIEAWRQSLVPQYITSNAFIAQSYARVVAGFLRDCQAAGGEPNGEFPALDLDQPVYLFELGAGSGRFAWLFLKKFLALRHRASLRRIRFRYVMTDFAERNLEYFEGHPGLRQLVEEGVLDFARFDAVQDERLVLRHSGEQLSAKTLRNPVVVVGNYFFDSIPLDIFHVENAQLFESLVTLTSPQLEPDWDDPVMLERLKLSYTRRPVSADYYEDPDWNRILRHYQGSLEDSSLHFPSGGLQVLRLFRELSGGRMLVLSADKGYLDETALDGLIAPGISVHGSFSMSVNFHALSGYIEHLGGQSLHAAQRPDNLVVVAFLLGRPPGGYEETRAAFEDAIGQLGPDEFYSLKKQLEIHVAEMSLEQLLAFVRFSGNDPEIFRRCLPMLIENAEAVTHEEQEELVRIIKQVGALHYPIGEEYDLPFQLGMMLFHMGRYRDALDMFRQSITLYGPDPDTLYNIALCFTELGEPDAALEAAAGVLSIEPGHSLARTLRYEIGQERKSEGAGGR